MTRMQPHRDSSHVHRATPVHCTVARRLPRTAVALALIALLQGLTSCAARSGEPTVRIIAGQEAATRYVGPEAYERFVRARLALHAGEPDAALEHLEAAIRHDPRSPYLNTELALVLHQVGRQDDALARVRDALLIEAAFPDALVLAARLHAEADRTAVAKERLRSCIEHNPKHGPAYLALADLLEQEDRPGAARRLLESMVQRVDDPAAAHERLAILCLRAVRYDCAARHLRRVLQSRTDLGVLLQLAHVQRTTGDARGATRLVREAFDRSGGDLRVAALLLELLHHAGDKQAVSDLLDVVERAAEGDTRRMVETATLALAVDLPARALALVQRAGSAAAGPALLVHAEALYEIGQKERALNLLREQQGGDHGEQASLSLARLLSRQGAHSEAVQTLRKAVTGHGPSERLVLALSQALQRAGRTDAAIEVIRRAHDAQPESRQLWFGLGAALERAGKWREAIQVMQQLLVKHPDDAAAHNFIGFTQLEHQVELDAAERSIRRALFLDPGEGYIIDSLGWLHFRRGNHARARQLLLMAARLAPDEPEILGHLAEVEAALGQPATAISLLKRAITSSEDDRLTRRLQARLRELEAGRVGKR